jgi:HlyD family secretion protein
LIARVESLPLAPLDPRQRSEAKARVDAAEDAQRESDAMVERATATYAGTPLIELSNPSNLEVLIELLSTDAVKVKPDALVLIERWGGDTTLHARVRLVEPSAFTKISALGVEEQRVNVIADFTKPPQTLARRLSSGGRHRNLGKPRRAENSIERTVSHRRCVDRFRCRRRQGFRCHVVVGRRTPFDVEIISGLNEGAQIIVHPSNEVTEARAVITQSN